MPSSASTPTTAIAALSAVIEVWKRVSAVRTSVTPPPTSENAPTTAGRTSPSRVSAGVPSTRTWVDRGSDVTVIVQAPGGSGTRPRSTPSLATSRAFPSVARRRPGSGSAAGSGRGGTVDRTVRPAAARAAAQSTVAVNATGW